MMQLGEIMDCFGNILLSCAVDVEDKGIVNNCINDDFLDKFFHDVELLNNSRTNKTNDYNLNLPGYEEKNEDGQAKKLSKLEKCMICFLDAATCFYYADESKKEAGSLNKIIRVILHYLRTTNSLDNSGKKIEKVFINKIKELIIQRVLHCYYKHYNNINLMELQRLKWIFSIQMYENISLNNLTIFPDIEDTMLHYYELWLYCNENENEL